MIPRKQKHWGIKLYKKAIWPVKPGLHPAKACSWTVCPIFSMIREDIGVAIGKLQLQLDAMKLGLNHFNQKFRHGAWLMKNGCLRKEAWGNKWVAPEKNIKELKEKVEKLEKFNCKKINLCVFGLKRYIEKGNPTDFKPTFFKDLLKKEDLPCKPAHWAGPELKLGSRPMIVRMQKYQAKEAILRLARSRGEFSFWDMRVKISLTRLWKLKEKSWI